MNRAKLDALGSCCLGFFFYFLRKQSQLSKTFTISTIVTEVTKTYFAVNFLLQKSS